MGHVVFKLPDIGEGIAEAEIVAWRVRVGERVTADQPLADVMTDKATVEIESPIAGVVTALAGEIGDRIAIGAMLVEFDSEDAGEAPPPEPERAAAPEREPRSEATGEPGPALSPKEHRRLASPAVRARAKDLGIDLADVKTADERVRHADLDAFLRYGSDRGYQAPHQSRAWADETVKVIGLRRRIAENMAAAKRHIPHFNYVEEFDVTKLEEMREDLNAGRGDKTRLTVLPLLIVALCRALRQYPMLNARYDDEADIVTRSGRVHLGIATQTAAGLMVPVLHDAQDKNVWQLATELRRLAEAARSGQATAAELTGSTITLSSLGPLGGIASTPVINRPEVAIIAPNRILERPVFARARMSGDELRRAKLMNVSISCDHRVVDGWDAASFMQAVKGLIEAPARLFAADH